MQKYKQVQQGNVLHLLRNHVNSYTDFHTSFQRDPTA